VIEPQNRALSCRNKVELRGLEPLTPTLPERGTSSEQGVEKARCPVADVVRHVPVVTVVVKTVVGTPAGNGRSLLLP
jgi:hypothetical protein